LYIQNRSFDERPLFASALFLVDLGSWGGTHVADAESPIVPV
jgi:hypothetical protein